MFEDYNLIKFIIVFSIIVGTLIAIYIYTSKFGGLPVSTIKGNIKILEIKQISKDKGFALIKVKNKIYFFSFDSSGIKLIEKFENFIDEEKNKNNNC